MKKKLLKTIIEILVIFALYFALLIPCKYFLKLYDGTEIRLSIVVSMVGGILFGYKSAIGVFFGNLIFDVIYNGGNLPLIIIGSLLNALASLAARYLFVLFNKKREEYYLSDFRSLYSYILTILIVNLILTSLVAVLLKFYSGSDYLASFTITFLNNIEFSLFLGIPILVYYPKIIKKTNDEFKTIKSLTFRCLTVFAIFTSLLFVLLVGLLFINDTSGLVETYKKILLIGAVALIINSFCFGIISYAFVTKVTTPLYSLTKDMRRESSMNEIDILKNKIDFIASNSDKLSGNEYNLYIGLSTKDGVTYDYDEAKNIINNIALKYVNGYISKEAEGGYKGDDSTLYQESTLIYKIFGADDEQINSIIQEVLKVLNQESILVDKNGINKYYCYKKS